MKGIMSERRKEENERKKNEGKMNNKMKVE